jgi:hypothetical protein
MITLVVGTPHFCKIIWLSSHVTILVWFCYGCSFSLICTHLGGTRHINMQKKLNILLIFVKL